MNTLTLTVPFRCKEVYESAPYWSQSGTIVEYNPTIDFADPATKAVCVQNWDETGDGNIGESEASVVTDLGWAFESNGNISSFDELRYFTALESINEGAFTDCSNLRSITIPSGVTSIIGSAFAGCSSLETLTVAEGNTAYEVSNGAIIEKSTNTLVVGTVETVIPSDVTSIGVSAFEGRTGLRSIIIPKNVTSIGRNAFAQCPQLHDVIVSRATPVTISSSVFPYRSQATLHVPSGSGTAYRNAAVWKEFGSIVEEKPITFADAGVKALCVGQWDDNGDGELSEREAAGVTNLDDLFKGNASITSFNELRYFTNLQNLNGQFEGCSKLTAITIPEGVQDMDYTAFSGCTQLESIVVSDNSQRYTSGGGANVVVDENTHEIIVGCKASTIPSGVERIGNSAFAGTDIISVTIPGTVTAIADNAFNGCSKLTEVKVEINTPLSIAVNVFSNRANATLYVPKGSRPAYLEAAYWKEFKEIKESAPIYATDDFMAAEKVTTRMGWDAELNIGINNKTTDLTAYQFDLTLPAGFTIAKNARGRFIATLGNRYEDDQQTLTVTQLQSGVYRVVCYSLSKEIITGTSGTVLTVTLTMDGNVVPGTYEASLTEAVATRVDDSQLWLRDLAFNIEVTSVPKGDTNNDGDINVADIVEIVNCINEKPSARFIRDAADMNGDGHVNVTDVVSVVTIIMAPEEARLSERGQMTSTDNDQLTLTADGGLTFGLWLTGEGRYVASQFDVRLAPGQTLEGIALNGSRTADHQMTCEHVGSGLYRVVVWSATGSPYRGDSGNLLAISVRGEGEVTIDAPLFVTANAAEKHFPSLYASTTGIAGVGMQLAAPADVYATDGRLVRSQATSLEGLPKGIYIINGKKQTVK